MAYLHKTPAFIRSCYPGMLWKKKAGKKELFLTFDDGPVPQATPDVLKILKKYNVKATFFCVGDNVRKYPELFIDVVNDGHAIGNHTFNHLNGWRTSSLEYIENVNKCQDILVSRGVNCILMRPPYGKITGSQRKALSKEYKIVMWDVLSGDFDPELSPGDCLENTIKATTDGSIIIFHDSEKAIEKVKYALPAFIEHFQTRGFNFRPL